MNRELVANRSSESPVKRVFVVGCPRSGTTWVGWLLSQHPAVVVSQQIDFFHSVLKPVENWWKSPFGSVVTSFDRGARDGAREGGRYAQTKLTEILSVDGLYELCRPLAVKIFDEIAAHKPGSHVVVEQTPENLELAQLILRVFPDAYFLHVIRDPRSVVSSLRSAVSAWGPEFPRGAAGGARLWCSYVQKGRHVARDTNRYAEVRYESLLDHGPEELERILSWLGLPFDSAFSAKAVEDCDIDKLRTHTQAPEGFFRKGAAESWREDLSSSELGVIEYIAGELMEELGYPRALAPSSRKPLRLRLHEALARTTTHMLDGPLRPLLRKLGRFTGEMSRWRTSSANGASSARSANAKER